MKKALTILAAAGMTFAMVGGASAADIPMMPAPPAAAPAPVAPPPPAFSFAGPYVGVHGGATVFNCDGACWVGNFGAQGGYNFEMGPAVVGLEFRTGLIFLDCDLGECGYSDLNLHAGAVLGDRTLVYGIAGVGVFWDEFAYLNLGIGAEFLITPDLGVFGQVMRSNFLGAFDEVAGYVFQVGINLH